MGTVLKMKGWIGVMTIWYASAADLWDTHNIFKEVSHAGILIGQLSFKYSGPRFKHTLEYIDNPENRTQVEIFKYLPIRKLENGEVVNTLSENEPNMISLYSTL